MDVSSVTPSTTSNPNGTLSVQARAAEAPVVRKSQVQDEPVQVPAVEKPEIRVTDDKREQRVKDAAHAFFKDTFVVSDSTFSIFKDSSGQYVTRFTNLRDGSVTYVPEPDIIRYMESRSKEREALLQINA